MTITSILLRREQGAARRRPRRRRGCLPEHRETTAASFTRTATGARPLTTPRTPSRRRSCGPGAGWPGWRAAARFAPGCTGSRPTSAWTRSRAGPGACSRSTTSCRALPGGPRRPLLESVWVEPYPNEGSAERRRRLAQSPLRAARGGRTRVHRGAAAPSPHSAPSWSFATCSGSPRARSPSRWTRPSSRSTARCRGPARRSISGSPSAATGDPGPLGDKRRARSSRLPRAWERADVEPFTRSSPRTPRSRCLRGRAGGGAATRSPASRRPPSTSVPRRAPCRRANGQPAVADYGWVRRDATRGARPPRRSTSARLERGRITEITAFVTAEISRPSGCPSASKEEQGPARLLAR